MKKCLLLPMLSLALVSATGCSLKNNDTIKYVGLKVYDPVYIAEDIGFFDEEGIDLKIVDTVAGGATAVQMVSSGDVQGALLSTMALINAKNTGLPVIGVADIQSTFKDSPLENFFVRKDSGITTIKDLKGKKIAINLVKSSFHYTWLMELEKNGMTEEDVIFVSLPFSEQQAALERCDVDAIGLMQPYVKAARDSEKLIKLYDAYDTWGERQFCEIFLNEKWASKNEDKATRFVSALRKAMDWTHKNQDEAKTIISKYTGVDVANIEDYKFQPNGQVVMEDAEYFLEYMKRVEGVSSTLTASEIVTNKYNTSVK